MSGSGANGRGVLVDDFVKQLTAQLDRAQDFLALKAQATGRPLTFALKDMDVNLRVFWEADPKGRLLMRHAGPNESAASEVRFGLTTITKAMVEENSIPVVDDEDPRSLDAVQADEGLTDDDRRRLDLLGIRTAGQLKRLGSAAPNLGVMEAQIGIPALRLQAQLVAAARPAIIGHDVVRRPDGRRLLRVRGANLSAGGTPEVRLSGEPVEVVQASATELLVRPLSHHQEGQVEVWVGGERAAGFFELPPTSNGAVPAGGARPLGSEVSS